MIAKCIVILAAVAQIYACECGCGSDQQSVALSGSGSDISPVVLVSSGASLDGSSSSGAVSRSIVANGKYPVALRNCGPTPDQQIPVTTSRLTTPVQEKPTVRIPACIPAPRTVSHSCTCYKTVLRPRVHQQIITVPTIERYVETSHKPVIENIQYEAAPVNCGSGIQFVQVGSGSCGSGAVQLVSVGSGTCGSQTVGLPIQTQPTQIISLPRSVEVPRVQIVDVPQVQTVQVPQSISLASCSCQC